MDFTLDDIEQLLRKVLQIELQPIKEDIQDLKERVSKLEDRVASFEDYATREFGIIRSELTVIRKVELPRLTRAVVTIAHHTSVMSPDIQELEAAI